MLNTMKNGYILGVVAFLGLLLISQPVFADDAQDVVLNIIDNQIVKLDDFMLVAQLSKEMLNSYDQFKMIIDDKEVPAKLLTEEGLLTYLPTQDFGVGKHLVKIIGVKNNVEQSLTEMGFGAVLKDLDKFLSGELKIEDALLAMGGEWMAKADIDGLQGLGKNILERDAGDALTKFATDFATDKWAVDLLALVDSQQGTLTQYYDRYHAGFEMDEMHLVAGETFPQFTDYTIKGRRLQGLSFSDAYGDLSFDGAWGKALRKIPPSDNLAGGITDPGSPGLDLYTIRVATGGSSPLAAGLTLLGGNESSFGPDFSFPGDDNRVVSMDLTYDKGKDLTFNSEYALAHNTIGASGDNTDGAAMRAELKMDSGDNTLSVRYQDIDPDFVSFGLNSLRTDIQGIEVDDRFNFDGGLTGSLRYERYRDNLNNASPDSRWTDSISGRATYRPNAFPGGFDFTYRLFKRSNGLDREATGAFAMSNESISLSGFVRGEFMGAEHQFRLTYADRNSDNKVALTGTDSLDLSVYWNMRFDNGAGLSFTLGKQDRDTGDISRVNDRYGVDFSYPFDDGKLILTGGYGFATLGSGLLDGNSNRLNGRFSVIWKITPIYGIEALYQRLVYEDNANDANSYNDDAFRFKLVRSF